MTQVPVWMRRGVRPRLGHNSAWGPISPEKGSRVYAIAFDLDTDALQRHYHGASWRNAYDDIRRILDQHHFGHQQGSVYFGAPHVTPVHCILAVQDIQKTYSW